ASAPPGTLYHQARSRCSLATPGDCRLPRLLPGPDPLSARAPVNLVGSRWTLPHDLGRLPRNCCCLPTGRDDRRRSCLPLPLGSRRPCHADGGHFSLPPFPRHLGLVRLGDGGKGEESKP